MTEVVEVPWAPYIALATGGLAVIVWTILLVRSIWAYRDERERRWHWLVMPTVGVLASLGTLASALGFAMQRGVFTEFAADPILLSFVSSMGRGALAMGGLVALMLYRPRP